MKRARRWVLAWFARRDGVRHDLGKLSCANKISPRSSFNNRCCNLFSKPLFAMIFDDLPDFRLFSLLQPCTCRHALRGIHAHIQRRIEPETETTSCFVQLRRGHPQIEQHTIDSRKSFGLQHLAQQPKAAVLQREARIAYFTPGGDGLRITIQRN